MIARYVDTRCQRCRRGHYILWNGEMTNMPCEREDCPCIVCRIPHRTVKRVER